MLLQCYRKQKVVYIFLHLYNALVVREICSHTPQTTSNHSLPTSLPDHPEKRHVYL
jgi:hypothetical protein